MKGLTTECFQGGSTAFFHRFQFINGIKPKFFNISTMDETQARIWIKLEWEALRKAI
jgi:hypothetical protein